MRVVFRADASHTIGTGHVMRCLTLATKLRELGAKCVFVCKAHPGNLIEFIQQMAFEVLALTLETKEFKSNFVGATDSSVSYEKWLGSSWQVDAEQTREALKDSFADWLILDHYGIGSPWERALRGTCRKILAIDDLANRDHDCDLLLDQNLWEDGASRYRVRVPSSCRQLLGPKYALLQKEYAALHPRVPPREGPIKSIFVYFGGGGDNGNIMGKALAALLSLDRPDIRLNVVIHRGDKYESSLRDQIVDKDHVCIHSGLATLAPLMVEADLAIGAAGATSWERCCLGLPTLIITVAKHQDSIASELHARGLCNWLGRAGDLDENRLVNELRAYVSRGVNSEMSLLCRSIVDGRGAQRVIEAMFPPDTRGLFGRVATMADEEVSLEVLAKLYPSQISRKTFRSWLRSFSDYTPVIVESNSGSPVALVVFSHPGQASQYLVSSYHYVNDEGTRLKSISTAIGWLRRASSAQVYLTGVSFDSESREPTVCKMQPKLSTLKISICTDVDSWLNAHIPDMIVELLLAGHQVCWVHESEQLIEGDICFLLGYGRIVSAEIRNRYCNVLVVHSSDLPKGRGWSPATWLILSGADRIPVTLIEAADPVDSGVIYRQQWLALNGTELIEEWRASLADATVQIVTDFVGGYPKNLLDARAQLGLASTYPRRRPKDSEVDPSKSLVDLFNVFRVADNVRYPVYFNHLGKSYSLRIEKKD